VFVPGGELWKQEPKNPAHATGKEEIRKEEGEDEKG